MGLTRGRELDPGSTFTLVAKARPFNTCPAKSLSWGQYVVVVGSFSLSNEQPLSPRSWPVPRLPSARAATLAPGHPTAGAGLLLVSGTASTCPRAAGWVVDVSLSFHRFLVSWAAVGEPGTCMLSFPSFAFAGGILGALFNALNYWLTMFRIR